MGDSFFRGTTSEQDPRFKDKQKKLLKSMKFPKAFSKKVDINKVEMKVIKPWIAEQIKEKLGFEDDVLIEYVYGMLGEKEINPKVMQINLTGFLEAESAPFMLKLWKLLLSAQENAAGIPEEILEKKKQELAQQLAEQKRIQQGVAQHVVQQQTIPEYTPPPVVSNQPDAAKLLEQSVVANAGVDDIKPSDEERAARRAQRRNREGDRPVERRDDRRDYRRDRSPRRYDDRRRRERSPRRDSDRDRHRRHRHRRHHSRDRDRDRARSRSPQSRDAKRDVKSERSRSPTPSNVKDEGSNSK